MSPVFTGTVAVSRGGGSRVARPVFDPPPPGPNGNIIVTITSGTPGATIRYTLDGSTPSATNGTIYTGPVDVTTGTNFYQGSDTLSARYYLKAIALKTGWTDSIVESGVYPWHADPWFPAAYHFDGDTTEATGRGPTLTPYGDGARSYTTGKRGLALNLQARNSGVSYDDTADAAGSGHALWRSSSAFSVLVWFKPLGEAQGNILIYENGIYSVPSYSLYCFPTQTPPGSSFGATLGNATVVNYELSPAGAWAFLALVFDGTNLKLSVNAGAFISATASDTLGRPGVFHVGNSNPDFTVGNGPTGLVDELMHFPTALTLADIANYYNNGNG